MQGSTGSYIPLSSIIKVRKTPGLWGFSAGHIEAGESAETCALRELEEEIGANFSIERLAILEPVRDHYYGGVYEINLFHHRWLGGEVELNHEHSQYAWVNRQDYKRYAVMDGIDEDIRYLDIWPLEFLNIEYPHQFHCQYTGGCHPRHCSLADETCL